MKCPYCGNTETKVVDKRETAEFEATRRRRECLKCEKRFTTYERVEHIDIVVIKKDGRKEPFDKEKIRKGVLRACEKRPVTAEQIKDAIFDIEFHLRNKDSIEVSSSLIGRMVMNRLRKIDKVSYIRFASVYKDFKSVGDFSKELEDLK